MHIERIRFDEIFDVAVGRGDFSFRSNGRTEYGVNLQGEVIPRAGATFALAFARPGDWSTVLGWRDLESLTVTLKHPVWSSLVAGMSDVILLGPLFVAGALLLAGPGTAVAVSLVAAGVACYKTFRVVQLNRSVRNALLAFEHEDQRH